MVSAVLAALCGATLLSVIHFAQRFQKRRLRKGDKAQVATSPKDRDKAFRSHMPLGKVVATCEARWFLEELNAAMGGDAEAMVRVGHMLIAGYGVREDSSQAASWLRQAWAIQSLKEPAERDAFMADALELPRSQVHALQHTSEMLEASGHSHAHAHGQEQARGPAAEDSTSAFLIAHTAQTGRPENADCDSMSMSVASEDGDEEEEQGLDGCGSSIEGFSTAGSSRHGGNRHASFSGAVGSAHAWRHARQTAGRPRLPVHTSEQHGLQQQWRQQQWQQCRLREQVNTANDEQPPVGELDDGDQEQPRLSAELQALDDDSWFDCLSDSYAAPQRVKHRPRRLGHLSRYKRQSPDVVPT